MLKNQKGFALIEPLIIVLILIVIGFGGYEVWLNEKDKNKPAASSSQINPNITDTKATLDIKEWGVKASYSGSQSLQYVLDSSREYAYITSPQLLAADSNCQAAATIRKALPNDPVDENDTAKQYAASIGSDNYAYIGGYYYFYLPNHSICSPKAAAETLQTEVNDEVRPLVPKLQAVPGATNGT